MPAPTRGVMSLWTKPPAFRVERGPLLIATLAQCLVNQAFPETQFITDYEGSYIAKRLGWKFSHWSADLENQQNHRVMEKIPHVWALGKLFAMAYATGPIIHVDFDVLLLRELPRRVLRGKLCAQSPDPWKYYDSEAATWARHVTGVPYGFTPYNAGIIGGHDHHLVRAYAWNAIDLAKKMVGESVEGTAGSMCIEQHFLGWFAHRAGIKVETLFKTPEPCLDQVERYSYVHLIGSNKRNPLYIDKCEARLKSMFPEAHEQFLAGWPVVQKFCKPIKPTPPCSSATSFPISL